MVSPILSQLGTAFMAQSQSFRPKINPQPIGKLKRMVGLTLEAIGTQAPIGSLCEVINPDDGRKLIAEVVGFEDQILYLMPYETPEGIHPKALVRPLTRQSDIAVGPCLLGRVINAKGDPLDGKGPLKCKQRIPWQGPMINPLARHPIEEVLDVGVKSINALLTVGKGQRLGIFAGTGVGKSVLLGMMTKFTQADVVVVGLVGERGREVKEFVDQILGAEGLQKTAVVASPADDPPLMRLHAAMLATRIAEYFRDQGLNVLLLMDSLTRFAQAQREIALAVGEPPATKGYPPSVFAKLPALVERAGNGESGGGSITAFYTVLAEGDDAADPILDAARGVLDGHILLSRDIAAQGIYPAIDVGRSISRVMQNLVNKDQWQMAQRFKLLQSTYEQNADLINVGAYRKGSDANIDQAIAKRAALVNFITQDMQTPFAFDKSLQLLNQALK